MATDWMSVKMWLDSRERQKLHLCLSIWTGSLAHQFLYRVCTKVLGWNLRSWAFNLATNPNLVPKFRLTGATGPLFHTHVVNPGAKLCLYLLRGYSKILVSNRVLIYYLILDLPGCKII